MMKKRFDKRYITWYYEGVIPFNILSDSEKEEVRRRNREYKRRYRMRKKQMEYWQTLSERIKKNGEETIKVIEEFCARD